jgi:hypothetical protein
LQDIFEPSKKFEIGNLRQNKELLLIAQKNEIAR